MFRNALIVLGAIAVVRFFVISIVEIVLLARMA